MVIQNRALPMVKNRSVADMAVGKPLACPVRVAVSRGASPTTADPIAVFRFDHHCTPPDDKIPSFFLPCLNEDRLAGVRE